MSQQFCLKWNNHMNNMMDVFKSLLSSESMVDVTLACDGLSLKAHKMVLSACSPFFQSLFLENPCKHPIVILKDMKYTELKAIIEFMYHGEVNVAQDQLSALMKTAETLRVKGLAEVTNEKTSSQSANQSQDEPSHRTVPRTESPTPQSKRRRGRVRKRSFSDSNRSDDSNEPKIKQPTSPDIEELSCDVTMDNSSGGQFSNLQSQVPMQSHSTNSFHKSVTQDPHIEEPASADESEFGVEPAKLLEQTLTTDDLSNQRRGRSSMSNVEMQRRPRSSTDHSSNLVPTSMPSESLSSNQQPDSPPDIKPELLELDPPMSPQAGPSHSGDNSMMMYMDQSSLSSHPGPSGYQDSSALVPSDSQPQDLKIMAVESVPDSFFLLSVPDIAETTLEGTPQRMAMSSKQAHRIKKPVLNAEWAYDFKIDWSNIDDDIMLPLQMRIRIEPHLRRKLVRILTNQIYNYCPHPHRKDITLIARQVVSLYPESLKDEFLDEDIGTGYDSMIKQLMTRIENMNRLQHGPRYVRSRQPSDIVYTHTRKNTNKKINNSCLNWMPVIPSSETAETQLQKKKDMLRMNASGALIGHQPSILSLLCSTYYSQREDINAEKKMAQLVLEWPYLFTKEGLVSHCEQLVGINFLETFKTSYIQVHQRIINYLEAKCKHLAFKAKRNNLEKMEFKLFAHDKRLHYLLSNLVTYFMEDTSQIFIITDKNTTIEQIQEMPALPTSPCVVVCGNPWADNPPCCLLIDKMVINVGETFTNAIVMMMCVYYALDVTYPKEACATLEFIQRCLLHINPSQGGKRPKRRYIHPKVLSLINKLKDYECFSI